MPFTQQLVEAISGKVPQVQTDCDESQMTRYEVEEICSLPESLRGLHELRMQLNTLGQQLESELDTLPENSVNFRMTTFHLAILEKRVIAIGEIIFSELLDLHPELYQDSRIAYLSGWRVVRLHSKKPQKKKQDLAMSLN